MFWYEDEVKELEKQKTQLGYTPRTLFYGSSSIRLWSSLPNDFKEFKPVNLGFGGSTLAACTWFFDRLIAPYQPERILLYAGDNDLGDGRHPEEVFLFFQQFAVKVQQRYGDIPCYFISIKPSPARWNMIDRFKYANNLVENEIVKQDSNWQFINIFNQMLDKSGHPNNEYFENDGLHLSSRGYELWHKIILAKLSDNRQTVNPV